MIGEILSQHAWLGTLACQSSLCLAAGLAGSFMLRRWPARAHQVLLITLIAAAVVPTLHAIVKEHDWGLFVKKAAPVVPAQTEPLVASDAATPPDTSPVGELEYAARAPVGQPHVDRTEPARAFHPMRWLFFAWALTGGILLCRLAVRFILSLRLARQAHPAELACVTDLLATARRRMGIGRDVAIRASERVQSPVIWCWARRPVLLIPSDAGRNGHRLDWTSILCHELAHWRRRDHLSGLFVELLVCVLPWQPLLWWARCRLVSLSEQACDDWVLASGQSGEDYAETLLDLTPQGRLAFAPSVVSSRRPLAQRIVRILQNSRGNPRPGRCWSLAAVAMAGCLALSVAFAQTRPARQVPPHASQEKLNEVLDAMLYHDGAVMPIAMNVDIERYGYEAPDGWQHRETYSFEQRLDGRRLDSILTRHRIEDGRPKHTQSARRIFTGEQYLYWQREIGLGQDRMSASLYPPEEAQQVMAFYCLWGGALLGYLDGDHRPVAAILKDSPGTVLHDEMENVDGFDCCVIEGSTDHGTYQLWVDPKHDFRIRRAIVHKGPGDLYYGRSIPKDVSQDPWTGPRRIRKEISGVKLEKIGGRFIPVAETQVGTIVGMDGIERRGKEIVKRSAIDLSPNFETRGAFIMNDIPEGTPLTIFDPNNRNYGYELRDGKAVPIAPNGPTIIGHVTFAGYDSPQNARTDRREFRAVFQTHATTEAGNRKGDHSIPVRLEEDGAFRIENVPPGKYSLQLALTEWWFQETASGGRIIRRGTVASANRELSIPNASSQPQKVIDLGVLEITQKDDRAVSEQTRPMPESPMRQSAQAEATAGAEQQSAAGEDKILLRLIDPSGRPVREAKAGAYVRVREVSVLGSRLDWLAGGTSDETGLVVLETKDLFRGRQDRAAIYILHEGRGIGAVHEIVRGEPGDGLPVVVLKPVCRVHGSLASTGLAAIGMPLRWANMYINSNDSDLVEYPFEEWKHDFELPLPPGTYTFDPYGSGSKEEGQAVITARAKFEEIPVVVSEGQHDLDLGVLDLAPTKLATMIGRPAPEIGPMKAWKNGSAVTLTQLRGQIVWLHFGGGYPGASRDLPRLVDLHEAFGDKGLTIIAIYNCASMGELEQRWAQANERFGGVQGVPFRIAVDGGQPMFFERTGREDPGATYGRYDITAYPTDVLIDPAGNVIGESHTSRAKQAISQMLGTSQEPASYPVNEGRTQAPSAAGQTRTLRFPQDRSLGILYMRDVGRESWYQGWEGAGEAKGNRFVGAGRQVKLEVNEQTAADLSPLAELDGDDLQMLCFGWEAVPAGSLAAVGKLTGLRALNLQSATFDSDELRHLTSLRHLEVLRLGGHKLTDSSMQYVGQLTSLRSLALWSTGISDAGLRHLQGLTQLTFLALNNCDITDDGLRSLHGMTALEGLQLPQTKISDAGLAHLDHLTHLTHINIGYDKITDAGLKHLEKLPQLENIWLNNNPITDQGFRTLAKMRNLKELYASDTEITDQGLAHLAGLPDLRHIITDGIGDEGLAHLSTLPSLASLQIHDAKVTPASIPSLKAMASLERLMLSGDVVDDRLLDALRAALPQCKVYDPQRSREYPMPEWRRRFEAVYRLEEGEVLKRIAPPFIPERMEYYREEHEHQAEAIPRGPDQMTFHWDRKLKNWGMGFGSGIGTLGRVLGGVLRLKSYEYDGPKSLLDLELPGDWIVRDGAPQEAKLRALENLIERELERRVRFEKGDVERDVIVATGSFRFHPPVGTYEDTSVHLYAGDSDENAGAGGGTADSVGEFLQMLGDRVNMPVIDRTEPSEEMRIPYRHHGSSYVRRVEDEQERARRLRMLLDNLTTQTELQFEVRRQPVEIWHVTTDNAG